MTVRQFDLLIEYIDAAIEKALDDGESSDEGLNSSIRKMDCKEELKRALVDNRPISEDVMPPTYLD